jgi:flagellar motor protein MotB
MLVSTAATSSRAGSSQQKSLPSVFCSPSFFRVNSPIVGEEQAACLDEMALQMKHHSGLRLVLDGHRDARERKGISLTRANLARRYLLEEQHVSSTRIIVRNFADSCPHDSGEVPRNGRVEMWLLETGTSTDTIGALKRCAPGFAPRMLTEKPVPWKGRWRSWD